MTRRSCTQKIFDVIIRLNHNRILGRLSSKHFSPPAYLHNVTKDPPIQQLVEAVQNLSPPKQKATERTEDSRLFQSEVRILHEAFQKLETSPEEDRLDSIGKTVKSAFSLTVNGVSLQNRLKTLGCNSIINSKVVHEINKVSNYWRISCTLGRLSRCREYRVLFAKMSIATLPPYPSEVRNYCSRYVHAEIQLLVHYELSPIECPPRIIGASKQACYLCCAFIRAHKQFHLPRSHNQIYNQWTVPNREDYTPEASARLQRALSVVNQEVLDEIKKTRTRPNSFRPFPLQSLINLRIPDFPDGSETTSRSTMNFHTSKVSKSEGADANSQRSGLPSLASTLDIPKEPKTDVVEYQDGGLMTRKGGNAPQQDIHMKVPVSTAKQTHIATNLSSEPKGLRLDWVDLHIHPSESAECSETRMELTRCENHRTLQHNREDSIDVDDWQLGHRVTIPINQEDPCLDIVFSGTLGSIRLRITSHTNNLAAIAG